MLFIVFGVMVVVFEIIWVAGGGLEYLGPSGFLLAAMGIVLGGVMVNAGVVSIRKSKVAVGASVKKCPQCAEVVKTEAVVCRYCGHDFSSAIAEAKAQREAVVIAAGTFDLVVPGSLDRAYASWLSSSDDRDWSRFLSQVEVNFDSLQKGEVAAQAFAERFPEAHDKVGFQIWLRKLADAA